MRQGLTIVPAGMVLVAGFLSLAACPLASAGDDGSPFDNRFGHPIAPIFLLLRPDVQQDLQLDERQIAGAHALAAQLIEQGLKIKGKTGPEAQNMRRQIDESMAAWVEQRLSDPQRERLGQIRLQWEGPSALRYPSIAEYLQLIPAQRARIDRLVLDRDRRQFRGNLSPAEFDRLSHEVLAVLHPVQKQRWDQMLGKPCSFSFRSPESVARNPRPAGVSHPTTR